MSLVVENLTKKYNNQIAVDNLSFSLEEGVITGFLGPNGAGKSTTMKMITGSLLPTKGTIRIENKLLSSNSVDLRSEIGYLPEHNPLYLEMYVREYLNFNADIYKVSKDRVASIIRLTGLSLESHKRIGQLSKGYRQRVGLAVSILHEPKILILDEPTTGLDPNQIIEIRNIIKKLSKNRIILLSSHIMQEIQALCDRVIILNRGKLVIDKKMKDLQGKEQTIEVAFDYRVEERLLKQLPNIKSVTNLYDFLYMLKFDTTTDMRSSIFDFATKNGLKILQINHKHQDLEKIFRDLTHYSS